MFPFPSTDGVSQGEAQNVGEQLDKNRGTRTRCGNLEEKGPRPGNGAVVASVPWQ